MYCNMLTLILNDLLCMDCDVKQTKKHTSLDVLSHCLSYLQDPTFTIPTHPEHSYKYTLFFPCFFPPTHPKKSLFYCALLLWTVRTAALPHQRYVTSKTFIRSRLSNSINKTRTKNIIGRCQR